MPRKKPSTAKTKPATRTAKKPAAKKAAKKAAPKRTARKAATAVTQAPPPRERETYNGPRKGNLIIVESPAKAKTIEKYLGSGYRVRASYGHVRDLPVTGKLRGEAVVGVDIGGGWKLRYQVIDRSERGGSKARRSTEDILDELKREADRAEMVYLATDPDREGESIAWHIEDELNLDPKRTRRITFNEITRKAVQEALQNARDIDDNLVAAQEARRALDRVVGYPLSNLLGKKVTRGLSAGRVQSVAVKLVVDREREIEAFRSEEYWKITALLTPEGLAKLGDIVFPAKVFAKKKGPKPTDEKLEEQTPEQADPAADGEQPKAEKVEAPKLPEGSFLAELAQWQDKPFTAGTEADADAVYNVLDRAAYTVTKVEQKDRNDHAPPPFTTSSLQQQASIRLHMGAQRTMQNAQRLYEGVNLGAEGQVALITYMRTDSTRVSNDALQMVRTHIENMYGPRYLPDKPNAYKSGKSAQEAHEAIRPTDLTNSPDRVRPFLDHDQHRLYTLIYNRFVASQMTPAIVAITNVDIQADRGLFRAKGQIEKFDGYRRVWPAGRQEDVTLPPLAENQKLDKLGLSASQHFTQPPPRYNEASLVKTLEKEGIGRPSTYATILSTITKKGYVEVEQRRFKATDLGKTVTDLLVKGFPNEMDLKFTSHFEEELDDIASGKMKQEEVLNEFWGRFSEDLKRADAELEKVKGRETGEMCPKCGRPLVEMYSSKRKGTFVGCSGWKDKESPCSYIKPNEGEQDLSALNVTCETCGSPMVARSSRWGTFLSCTQYKPDGTGCNTIANLTEDGKVIVTCRPTQFPCPTCGKNLLWRLGKKGPYFTCPDKECKTTLEADKTGERPLPPIETGLTCEKCGSKMVVKKSWRGPFLSCSGYPKCRNAKSLTKELKEKFKDQLPVPAPKKEVPQVEVKELCPECGSPMKLISARGRYFLGCTTWQKTKCKGTRQLSPELMQQIQEAEGQAPAA
ncbi:MAG TPA: type I DNA topoisomerase [Gemmataceae bacterium]|nr:type I DNA topoisomerase [Gemmataceae bacterium]